MQREFFRGLARHFSVHDHFGWAVSDALSNWTRSSLVVLSDWSNCVLF